MAAILGLDDAKVEEICSGIKNEIVVPANYNCPGQIVISGSTKGIEQACVLLKEAGANLEVTGIRVVKYVQDRVHQFPADNDLVLLRLADVLLMKAEAILRGGTGTNAGPYGNTALGIVNYIRTLTSRGASALAAVTLDQLLDERGRELYLEGWRRQDLIRFGKFLAPFQEKPEASDPKYLLFAIPNQQLAVNPNLTKNPGY